MIMELKMFEFSVLYYFIEFYVFLKDRTAKKFYINTQHVNNSQIFSNYA